MLKKLIVAGAALAAGTIAASAADLGALKSPPKEPVLAPIFFVNDNTISYSYQFNATDPGVPGKFGKNVVSFTHFDVWAYGTNFFTVDYLKSPSDDPASPCGAPGGPTAGCAGAAEIYGLFRSTIGFNQLFGTKAFTYGPMNNVSFAFGADANTMNTFLAPAVRKLYLGLQFSFDLPYKGYFNVATLYRNEWNHNAFAQVFNNVPGGNTHYDGTWAIETNYAMPLGFLPAAIPLTFSGRAGFYGPKGTGSPLLPEKTKLEFNSEQRLTLDVGKIATGRAGVAEVFVAYRYWQNKFGLNTANMPGVCSGANKGSCTENAFTLGTSLKF